MEGLKRTCLDNRFNLPKRGGRNEYFLYPVMLDTDHLLGHDNRIKIFIPFDDIMCDILDNGYDNLILNLFNRRWSH